jgi:hypothetical protein
VATRLLNELRLLENVIRKIGAAGVRDEQGQGVQAELLADTEKTKAEESPRAKERKAKTPELPVLCGEKGGIGVGSMLYGEVVFKALHGRFQLVSAAGCVFLLLSFLSTRLRNMTTGLPQSAQNSDARNP